MKLETQRLQLRGINESHVEDILKIRSNETINRFVQRNSPKNNYEALQFILTVKENAVKGQSFYWGISLKDRPGLIGTICLRNFSEDRKVAEVGYELLPEYHRKGIMSEALAAVVDFAFQHLSIQTLLAVTTEENDRSQRLLLKQGFIPEKTEEDNGFPEKKVFSLQGL